MQIWDSSFLLKQGYDFIENHVNLWKSWSVESVAKPEEYNTLWQNFNFVNGCKNSWNVAKQMENIWFYKMYGIP